MSSSSICLEIEIVFHFPFNWVRPPFSLKLRPSSLLHKLRLFSIFLTMEVVFHFPYNWCCLPFCLKIEVVFHVGSYFTPVSLLGQHSLKCFGTQPQLEAWAQLGKNAKAYWLSPAKLIDWVSTSILGYHFQNSLTFTCQSKGTIQIMKQFWKK